MAKATVAMWAVPAALLTIAGYRYVFDRPPAPLVATYVDISRGLVPLLAAFTVLIGGIWLVRSGRSLRATASPSVTWSRHGQALVLAAVALGASLSSTDPRMSTLLATAAATLGLFGGLAVPRWLLALERSEDSDVIGWVCLSTVMAFELSIGWLHSAALVDGASILSGGAALARGLVLGFAVATVLIPGTLATIGLSERQLRRFLD